MVVVVVVVVVVAIVTCTVKDFDFARWFVATKYRCWCRGCARMSCMAVDVRA